MGRDLALILEQQIVDHELLLQDEAGETASSGQALTILQNKDQNFTEVNGLFFLLLQQFIVALSFTSFTKAVRDLHEECHHSERHFDLSSSLIGLIDGSFEMGNLLFLAVVSHFGAKLHQPRLIAMGCFHMAVGSFLTGLPHFFMGRAHLTAKSSRLPTS
ncbi:solute carrier organic anion transporter family member 1B1-like [Salvelinus namaycush]|uniref:Solute carrier organic anion transporter family member 1B1-like n=1 Tax=Salvelinus namaycush TaxID=8040 RepID=A0A8U0PKB5_SALNM|nr:solute carrier organic anion transporter family member 1B1-like [Salvelinus namaycush]